MSPVSYSESQKRSCGVVETAATFGFGAKLAQLPFTPPFPPDFATTLVELCKRWHAEISAMCKVADCNTEVQQMECASLQIVAQRFNRWSVQGCILHHRDSTDGVCKVADCSAEVQQMECARLQIVAQRFRKWSVQGCRLQHRGSAGEWQRSPLSLHALRVEGPRRRGPKQKTKVTMMTVVMTVNGDQR